MRYPQKLPNLFLKARFETDYGIDLLLIILYRQGGVFWIEDHKALKTLTEVN